MLSTTRPARSAPPNRKPSERLSVGSRSTRSIFSIFFTRDWA